MRRSSSGRVTTSMLGALMIATIAACGTSFAPRTSSGTNTVTVLATGGTAPIYSWTGPLAVSLDVARTTAPSVSVWGVTSPIKRDIAPGVQHGVVPQGANETASAERALTAGIRYRVTVALADGTAGSVDFTP